MAADINKIKELLKLRLDEKRYYHSLCVADAAKRLSEKYGGNPGKMYIAGLLHDVTKRMPNEEQLKLFKKFGIMLSVVEMQSPLIWHAISGALFVEHKLGIKDVDILSAIRYHTTGKANMTLSEKIIFVADLISADREYPDIEEVRDLADISLEDCILRILRFTINDIVSKQRVLHPDTLEAYNYLIMTEKGDTQ